jgi:putative DNA primase/helicase
VNPWLAHLLSRAYDGALAPEHLVDLRKSTLTDETIRAQFIRSVPPSMIPRLLGFELPGIQSALLFPFRSPAGGFIDHVRLKVFPPVTDGDGHTIKYLQPKGSAPRLYIVAGCLERVLRDDEPLWITEGEKKALAVAQLGYPVIGIVGVQGWHAKGSCLLLPDFDRIRLRGRVIELLPDSDYQTNPDVERAIRSLGYALAARGAQPGVRLLPRELPQ